MHIPLHINYVTFVDHEVQMFNMFRIVSIMVICILNLFYNLSVFINKYFSTLFIWVTLQCNNKCFTFCLSLPRTLGVVAEWSKVLIAVPWPLMVWSTLALGTYQLRFVSWVFHVIFSFCTFHFTLHFGWPAYL